MSAFISLRDASKIYRSGTVEVQVLNNLNFDIQRGEFVAFMGPSGSGKTTLLNLIGGLDRLTSGSIVIAGQALNTLSEAALTRWRGANVGFVFQMYYLLPALSAEQNIELPLLLKGMTKAARMQTVRAALQTVKLGDRAKHKPAQLSGGQQQRVAIARALVGNAPVIVCDEPTGNLDRDTATEVLELLGALNRELGKTIVLVTHDPKAAERASRVVHVDKGSLVESARAAVKFEPRSMEAS